MRTLLGRSSASFAFLILSSCASPTTAKPSIASTHSLDKSSGMNASLSSAAAQEFREIQTLYGQARSVPSYDQVIARITGFEKKFPRSPHLAQAYNLKGMAYLMTRRPMPALPWFQKSLELSDQESFRQHILYNLATAQTEAQQPDEAERSLAQITVGSLPKEMQVKVHSLGGRLALKRGRPDAALRHFLALGEWTPTEQESAPYTSLVEQASQGMSDLDALQAIADDAPESPLSAIVSKRIRDLEQLKNSSAKPSTIGVLLPMSGKFARYGATSLQGIELALGIFNGDRPDSKLNIVIEDSGETPESALKALNKLALQHRVGAVIGPLLSKGVEPLAKRALELGVPVLSLAQQPITNDYFFSAAVTPQSQAQALARYAIQTQGLKRFAILHPRNKFGEQYSQAFWDAVEALGGSIRGVESYDPDETDFREVVGRLSGLHYLDARKREAFALGRLREEQNITKRSRKTEQFFALPPVVDYDAVFIPDEPKAAGQILPTFLYRDVKNMKFLGTTTWHTPELIQRAQNHAENAYFVDTFAPEAPTRELEQFTSRYRTTFKQEPGSMEAVAHDAAELLRAAFARTRGDSRTELRDELKRLTAVSGSTGKISFKDGRFERPLTVLTVKNGQIVPAP